MHVTLSHFRSKDQRELLWFKCDIPQLSRCVTTSTPVKPYIKGKTRSIW